MFLDLHVLRALEAFDFRIDECHRNKARYLRFAVNQDLSSILNRDLERHLAMHEDETLVNDLQQVKNCRTPSANVGESIRSEI